MQLITPDLGTAFWMLIVFGIVLYVLAKFAWKPILSALKQREGSIASALNAADKARKEMAKVQADNEKILAEAKAERDSLLKEAQELKQKIISEAKEDATKEAQKIVEAARTTIENEKAAIVNDIRKQVAVFSVEIAEKVLREKLSASKEQQEMIDKMANEIKLN